MPGTMIFGASRGLGREIRKVAEENGEIVTGWSRKDADLSTPDGQTRALKFIDENAFDKVFYVPGGGPYGLYHRKEWKDHDWAFQVTFLFPAKLLHRLASRSVQPQVVVIGSGVAENAADPNAASYCAAKHALRGLFSSLRSEYPNWDLRLFSPGYIDTEMLPQNAAVRSKGVYSPATLAQELWSWTLTSTSDGHKMYPKHPE